MSELTSSNEKTCEGSTADNDNSKSRFLDALEKKKHVHRIRNQENLSVRKISSTPSKGKIYKVHRRKSG